MTWLLKQSILWHRYLGLFFCVLFATWFASGIVMMYANFPQHSGADDLAHAPPLDLRAAKFTPDQAFSAIGLLDTPEDISVGILGDRPVYRARLEGRPWITVFADDASVLRRLSDDEARRVAASYDGVPLSKLRAMREIREPDQWTIYPGWQSYIPFEVVAADDGQGTEYYVSERTGTVYLRATRRDRLLAWFGAIPHWWYIRGLRAHDMLWDRTMIVASSLGAFMCVAGILTGLLRFSPSRRYRFPTSEARQIRHSAERRYIPYAGWKRWHYLLTMCFGLVTFTWILSGLFTMDPGDWSPGADAGPDEQQAFAGGDLDTSTFQVAPAEAAARAAHCVEPAALEMIVFDNRPYYLAQDRAARAALVAADAPAAGQMPQCLAVPKAELLAASERVVAPGARIVDSAMLTAYDAYYYDRTRQKPLPVLRVRFADPNKTWLYLDPSTARIVARYTNRSRAERWLYQGLHDLDFPFLYWHRPAWDLTVIGLCLGGMALSSTGIVMAFKYLRHSARRHLLVLRR